MNTRSKRASSVGILLGFAILAPVAPDGTIGQGDREHIAWSYSGIVVAAAIAAVGDWVVQMPADDAVVLIPADVKIVEV